MSLVFSGASCSGSDFVLGFRVWLIDYSTVECSGSDFVLGFI